MFGRPHMAVLVGLGWAVACEEPLPTHSIPGHSECFDEPISAQACRDLVEEDGRLPTTPRHSSPVAAPVDDDRVTDPDLLQLRADIDTCACTCCHTSDYGGPGLHKWDVTWEPVWVDSASSWSLQVLSGLVPSEDRQLPHDNPEWVKLVIQTELDRRDAAKNP